MKTDQLIEELERLIRQLQHGCCDGGCCISPPKGQHTNGGCQCYPRQIGRHLRRIGEQVETLRNW